MNRSIAQPPKERVNIAYRSKEDGAQAETELPLKMLVVGDFTGRTESTPIEERQTLAINKDNFDDVMASLGLHVDIEVDNKLQGRGVNDDDVAPLALSLAIKRLNDFSPEQLCSQSEPLQKLLQLRAALVALKGPLGNFPQFRRKLEHILHDAQLREQLLQELGNKASPAASPGASQQPTLPSPRAIEEEK